MNLGYLETQRIAILLKQNKFNAVSDILRRSRCHCEESDLQVIRLGYMLDYYRRIGDDHHALIYLERLTHLNDSVRSERQRLATAETAFRYQQDSKALKLELSLSKSKANLRTSELFLVDSVLVIVALVALFFFVMAYNRNKRTKILQKAKKHVLKLRMDELRNRVSPHFIFNVLSYELYNRQHGIATTDIPLLVRLIRNGLEVSDDLCVSVSKELDFVDDYVELQRKGLGDNFVYELHIADDVDIDTVMIPSMIVQIAVENAIKHGLRGLERDKMLNISVDSVENATRIAVMDNGRGVDSGMAGSSTYGTGTGTKVIRETLEMLNALNNKPMSYEMRRNPRGSGCRVEIIIPNGYNYTLD